MKTMSDHYSERPELICGNLGDASNITIPAIFTSYTTAHLLISLIPKEQNHVPGKTLPDNDGPYRMKSSQPTYPSKSTNSIASNTDDAHEQGTTVSDEPSVEARGFGWFGNSEDPDSGNGDGDEPPPDMSHGLWIVLTPKTLSTSPFVDTLLVLVVSPLVTLTIVYSMSLTLSISQCLMHFANR